MEALHKVAFIVFIMVVVILISLTGCGNKDIWDFNYTFDKAIIKMPDGNVLELEIKYWNDYDGEQIQVVDKNGIIYLVSSVNCVLIKEN